MSCSKCDKCGYVDEMIEMNDVVIGFKSGKEITLKCEDCTLLKNKFTGELTEINWHNININLMYIDLNEIAYVYQKLKGNGDIE